MTQKNKMGVIFIPGGRSEPMSDQDRKILGGVLGAVLLIAILVWLWCCKYNQRWGDGTRIHRFRPRRVDHNPNLNSTG